MLLEESTRSVLARIAQQHGTPCYVYFVPPILARAEQLRSAARGRAPRRALGQHREGERLVEGELTRTGSKVDPAGRGHAFDVPAVRRRGEIRLEQFRLRVMPLELQSAQDLQELPAKRARMDAKAQPRQLHRHGRAPDRAVAHDVGAERSAQ